MSDPLPQADLPRSEVTPDQKRNAMADPRRPIPAWNREQLIEQFQRIDGSTRTEAEREIAAYEYSFSNRLADLPRR